MVLASGWVSSSVQARDSGLVNWSPLSGSNGGTRQVNGSLRSGDSRGTRQVDGTFPLLVETMEAQGGWRQQTHKASCWLFSPLNGYKATSEHLNGSLKCGDNGGTRGVVGTPLPPLLVVARQPLSHLRCKEESFLKKSKEQRQLNGKKRGMEERKLGTELKSRVKLLCENNKGDILAIVCAHQQQDEWWPCPC